MARDFVLASEEYLKNTSPPITAAPFSVSCWYNYPVELVAGVIFSLADKDVEEHEYMLYVAADDLLYYVRAGGGFVQTDGHLPTTNPNEWNHACITEGGSSRQCFMNGDREFDLQTREPANVDQFALSLRSNNYQNAWFGGRLAEFGWWNVGLSIPEITMLNLGYSPLLIRPQSLVVYIPMIRDDDNDLISGLSMSVGGTPTVGKHPRVLYPRK